MIRKSLLQLLDDLIFGRRDSNAPAALLPHAGNDAKDRRLSRAVRAAHDEARALAEGQRRAPHDVPRALRVPKVGVAQGDRRRCGEVL